MIKMKRGLGIGLLAAGVISLGYMYSMRSTSKIDDDVVEVDTSSTSAYALTEQKVAESIPQYSASSISEAKDYSPRVIDTLPKEGAEQVRQPILDIRDAVNGELSLYHMTGTELSNEAYDIFAKTGSKDGFAKAAAHYEGMLDDIIAGEAQIGIAINNLDFELFDWRHQAVTQASILWQRAGREDRAYQLRQHSSFTSADQKELDAAEFWKLTEDARYLLSEGETSGAEVLLQRLPELDVIVLDMAEICFNVLKPLYDSSTSDSHQAQRDGTLGLAVAQMMNDLLPENHEDRFTEFENPQLWLNRFDPDGNGIYD